MFHLAAELRAMMAERPPSDSCEGGCFIAVSVIRLSTATLLPRRCCAAVTADIAAAATSCRYLLQVAQARPRRRHTRGCTAAVGEIELSATTLLPTRHCAAATAAVTAAGSGRRCLLQVARARPRRGRTHRDGTTAVGKVELSTMTRLGLLPA